MNYIICDYLSESCTFRYVARRVEKYTFSVQACATIRGQEEQTETRLKLSSDVFLEYLTGSKIGG